MKNRAIRELYGRWKFNADLMTCQACGYSVIASRMHETAYHAAGCRNTGDRNPWLQLEEILHSLKVGEGEKARLVFEPVTLDEYNAIE
jgi:hypothetical protein